jgi:transcriptional regulator with XRE-family HTH domain
MKREIGFGSRIKELRKSKKFTAEELANKIQVSQVAILKYEKEQMRPTWENLERLATALDTTVEYLRYGGDEPIKKGDSVDTVYEMSRRLLKSKSDLKALEKLLMDFVTERVSSKMKD